MNTTSHTMNPNSELSTPNPLQHFYASWVFDILFGVVPAVLFGALSIIGMGGVVNGVSNYGFDALAAAVFGLSLLGLLACLALIVVIVSRGRIRPEHRWYVLVPLGIGAFCATVVTVLYLVQSLSTLGDIAAGSWFNWVVFALTPAITATATKYILILTLWRTP